MASLKVHYGELTKPLEVKNVPEGTTIVGFCEKYEIEYSSKIKVNGASVNKQTVLKAGDVITCIPNVDGGYEVNII